MKKIIRLGFTRLEKAIIYTLISFFIFIIYLSLVVIKDFEL